MITNDYVEVLNLATGARGKVLRHIFENPSLNPGILEEVEAGTKPFVPELYKSKVNPQTPPLLEDNDEDESVEEDA